MTKLCRKCGERPRVHRAGLCARCQTARTKQVRAEQDASVWTCEYRRHLSKETLKRLEEREAQARLDTVPREREK